MKNRNRDDAYWTDAFMAFYIDGNFGPFADALKRFEAAFPEYRAHLNQRAKDRVEWQLEKEIMRLVAERFRRADQEEHTPAPTPETLRDVCLPFHVDPPPMSQTVMVEGGRLGFMDASPKHQVRHQIQLKQFHRRGFVYRERNEQEQVRFIEQLQELLPGIERLGDLSLRRIMELLKERDQVVDRDDDNATTAQAFECWRIRGHDEQAARPWIVQSP